MGKSLEEILINKKIKVVPIVRPNGIFPKGHDGEFMYTGTFMSLPIPRDSKRKALIEILAPDEREAFENLFNLPKGTMNFYDVDNPYWAKYRVKLNKEEKVLDLSVATDFLEYRTLLANKSIVAPNWESRNKNGEYKFVLVDEDEQVKTEATKAEISKTAWKYFGKLEDSVEDMQNVLRLYGKKTTSNKLEFLRGEISKLIESDIKEFIRIMEDPKLKMKVFIDTAVMKGILDRTSTSGYALKGGVEIGRNVIEVIEFLESPRNQDIYLKIKAQVENSK